MSELHQQLDHLAHGEDFGAADPAGAVAAGRAELRIRRRRRTGAAVAGSVALSLVALLGWDTVAGTSLEFGEPTGVPLASGVPAALAYPDLVVSRSESRPIEIEGFGWPIEGMASVSGVDGELRLPAIEQAEGESMCLPMLEQAAPEVPADRWRHSGSGVERFPLRATLAMTVEAEHDGVLYLATCTLPGDSTSETRPDLDRVPDPGRPADRPAILDQCSYLAHVDFSGWQVVTGVKPGAGSVAVLVSRDDHVATCALASEPAGRAVRISELTEPPTPQDPLVYDATPAGFSVAGRAPVGAAEMVLKVGRQAPVSTGVEAGVFAIAAASTGSHPVARLTAYDARGVEVGSWSTAATDGPTGALLASECFYTVERDRGAC